MSFLGQDEQIREYQLRFRYLYIALFLAITILLARLWYLQILNGDRFKQYSEENRIKKVRIATPRGMIFDRNKKLLVDNRPAFDLEITPQELYADKNWRNIVERLARILKIAPDSLLETLQKAKGQPAFLPIKAKHDLTSEEVALIEAHKLDLPGISVQMEIKRTNIYGELAAHLVGYISEVNQHELPKLNKHQTTEVPYKTGDVIGKSGLEARLENDLRGIDGEEYIEVDAFGRRKRGRKSIAKELKPKPGVPGKNLVLTIDQDLQLAAKASLDRIYGNKQIAAVIALNPKTGEVLAALSQPSFDPTVFARGVTSKIWKELNSNEYKPLRDKTIQDHYSPGSTFKAITAIAGLEEKLVDEHTTVNCSGQMQMGNRAYRCWKRGGHGNVNVHKALKESCDVYFYRLGQRLGIDTLAKYAKMLGLGTRTGINLAHEATGLMPTEAWKKKRFGQEWIAGETLSCAIGQSYVLTTPLQLANAYAAIANGGLLWKPFIVKYIESPDGKILKEFQPELISQVHISERTLQIVRDGLHAVVNEPGGTTYSVRIPGIDLAGKTGTTQVVRLSSDKIRIKCEAMPFNIRDNALFAAYAPPDDPKIAVAVVAEHACHGNTSAAPIAIEVIKTFLAKSMPERYSEAAIKSIKANGGKAPSRPLPIPDEESIVRTNDIPEGLGPEPLKNPDDADDSSND